MRTQSAGPVDDEGWSTGACAGRTSEFESVGSLPNQHLDWCFVYTPRLYLDKTANIEQLNIICIMPYAMLMMLSRVSLVPVWVTVGDLDH